VATPMTQTKNRRLIKARGRFVVQSTKDDG
jgi:hypothetical protein